MSHIRISPKLLDPDPAEAAMTPEQVAEHRQAQFDQRTADTAKKIDEQHEKTRPGKPANRL